MAWTTTDVETLEAAIASGQLRVQYGDRVIQYQSLESMRAARREMKAEIAATAGTARRRTYRVTQKGTGL